MLLQALAFAAAIAPTWADSYKVYKHVAAFSVDGLHGSDVEKYVAKRPGSTIATLLKTAYEYTDCYTSAPSDSFPGVSAFVSGADPRTTGVWYDDTYDRTFWAPYSVSGKNCSGSPGAEVTYDESIDYDSTKLWSGGINPANLPQSLIGGKCTWTYPHQRIRVNTIYEIVEASGKQTAYADKHPAYDLVRGPSGKGLSVGYFPEIQSFDSTNVSQIIGYDKLHVDAFLSWIGGTTPANSEVQDKLTGIPTLFGGNFQAVSVAQKTHGYVAGSLDFTPELLTALDFVDASLGKVVAALKAKKFYDETLIIVASKHGQAPIDPTKYNKVSQHLLAPAIKVPVSFITTDDIALVFLSDARDTDAAVDNLNKQRDALKIADVISGKRLTYLGYGDPAKDPAVPHIIIRPKLGTIYTTSTAKIAEHGGISDDDRRVACFASASDLQKKVYNHRVYTKEFAPTILQALGLNPNALQGVVAEAGKVIDGFRG